MDLIKKLQRQQVCKAHDVLGSKGVSGTGGRNPRQPGSPRPRQACRRASLHPCPEQCWEGSQILPHLKSSCPVRPSLPQEAEPSPGRPL